MSNKLKYTWWGVCLTVTFLLFSVLTREVLALEVSSQQIQMFQQLPESEKAKLAASAGIKLPNTTTSQTTKSSEPISMPPREVGGSSLEDEMKKDANPDAAEVKSSAKGIVPDVSKITSPQQGESLEIRKAFADIAEQSRPLQVPTDIKQFGYELFAGNPNTFAPATDIPVPSEYVLGPGDEIKIHLYGRTDQEFTAVVDREGEIAFPSLGALSVAGMSFIEAKAMIAQQVKDKLVGITADVSMGKLRSIRVFALGDVDRPGSYTVSGLSTISHALFISGGIKKTGSLRNIQLKRHGKIITTIDLYDFLLKGDTSKDVRLLPGDVVFVPPLGITVGVAGQVLRPAIYELQNEVDVADLITLAGGLSPRAYTKMALIERIDRQGGKSTIKISLENFQQKNALKNGDLLKIFSVTDYENNPVYLIGHVKRPGKYAWHNNMTLVEILPSLDDLLPEAKLDYAVIERETGVNREATMIHFNLREILNGKQTLMLQPRDKVFIFSRASMRQLPVVKISGSVPNPGRFELKKNMRLVDLLMVAGGGGRDADLDNVEIFRLDPKTNKTVTYRYSVGTIHGYDSLGEAAVKTKGNKDFASNPILQDLDEVVIHSVNERHQKYFVTIIGEVHHPGEFVLGEDMRLTDLVYSAGNVTEKAYLKIAEVTRYEVIDNAERKVTHFPVNLAEALSGDAEANIKLEPYDAVTIQQISTWQTKDLHYVQIGGEVRKPGDYLLWDNMRLTDLVLAAGNVTEKAYLKVAEVTRYTVLDDDKRQVSHFPVNLKLAVQGNIDANIPLKPYDIVTVRPISNWRSTAHVTVGGEVTYPGSYPIEDGEHLSSVLKRAGGFTGKAFLPAAVFIRNSILEAQKKKLSAMTDRVEEEIAQQESKLASLTDQKIMMRQQKSINSAKQVLAKMQQAKATGRLVIRLSNINEPEGKEYDLTLRDGDNLVIPQKPDEVLVMGQVYNNTALLYNSNFTWKDYVKMAGGPTRLADTSHIYVMRVTGMLERVKGGWKPTLIGPGDAIVIPQDLDKMNFVDTALDWSKVLYQLGIAAAAMQTIGIF